MSACIDHGLLGNKKEGYHQVRINGKLLYVHRLALAKHLGKPVGELSLVRHLCNNPRCVNVEHLAEGSHYDNAQDRVRSGRSAKVVPERRKLSADGISKAKAMYAEKVSYHGDVSYKSIGLVLGVSERVIRLAITRENA
jgi:mRNA degradation ribonuclease J1/J2